MTSTTGPQRSQQSDPTPIPSSIHRARGENWHAPGFAKVVLHRLVDKLQRGEGEILYRPSGPLQSLEVGPQNITVIGAPPGAGKTALAMQFAFEAIEVNQDLIVVVANAEMAFDVLLRRELTRRSGVPSRALRFAQLTPHQLELVKDAAAEIVPLLDRVRVIGPQLNAQGLACCLNEAPGLLVVDYLQKFAGGDDARLGTNAVMTTFRELAANGWGVLALSATTRSRGRTGSSAHDSNALSMASLKESGEIEFNADNVYLMRDQGPVHDGSQTVRRVWLDHAKNRHGERQSIDLVFDMPAMAFRSPAAAVKPHRDLQPFSGEYASTPSDSGSNPFAGGYAGASF